MIWRRRERFQPTVQSCGVLTTMKILFEGKQRIRRQL